MKQVKAFHFPSSRGGFFSSAPVVATEIRRMEGVQVQVPSLVSPCIEATCKNLLRGAELPADVYELPPELFDELLMRSPSLLLQKLHAEMTRWSSDGDDALLQCSQNDRKRRRCGNFDRAWRVLFRLRWSQIFRWIQPADWQQTYWETHLQDCLNEAAEKASLPSFDDRISDILISDNILNYIGCEQPMDAYTSEYLTLSHHCRQFRCYLRSLKLQNVLCVEDICDLLKNMRLENLTVWWIRTKEHVDALSNILIQNSETLASLNFIDCSLSRVDEICNVVCLNGTRTHGIQHFSVCGSAFLNNKTITLNGLSSFVLSGRSLSSLRLCSNQLNWKLGKLVLTTLLDASSDLSILDISDNDIGGWLCNFKSKFLRDPMSSLRSLRVLNLRENNLQKEDMDNLKDGLRHIPNLEMLDLRDNPIEDDGVRRLMSFFTEASEERSPLHELNLENCDLSRAGVTELLSTISTMKRPLRSLSIAENHLGSEVAVSLRGFIGSQIQELNIGGIGLGSSGFQELQKITSTDIKLSKIDMSKNRGGIEAAKFLSRLVERAPKLVMVNASYNLMPAESLIILSSALKEAKAPLEHVDLRGNSWGGLPAGASELLKLKHNGKPVVLLSSSPAPNLPYDQDP